MGNRKDFCNFAISCKSYFQLRARSSDSEEQRVTITISLLQDDAQAWVFSMAPTDPAIKLVEAFIKEMGIIYGDPDHLPTREIRLQALWQSKRTAKHITTMEMDSVGNDPALSVNIG